MEKLNKAQVRIREVDLQLCLGSTLVLRYECRSHKNLLMPCTIGVCTIGVITPHAKWRHLVTIVALRLPAQQPQHSQSSVRDIAVFSKMTRLGRYAYIVAPILEAKAGTSCPSGPEGVSGSVHHACKPLFSNPLLSFILMNSNPRVTIN